MLRPVAVARTAGDPLPLHDTAFEIVPSEAATHKQHLRQSPLIRLQTYSNLRKSYMMRLHKHADITT